MQIATFSVRNVKRIGQLPELTADHYIHLIRIQEHIYINSEDIKCHNTDSGWTFAWKNFMNTTIGDAGMLIRSRALNSLISIEKIQPRMIESP